MISFIIIGRNEGWKLTKCFDSVLTTIKQNQLKDYEVIYVDSLSIDDSIARAMAFNTIKSFKITGTGNAAIARNIGAKEANGDVLFFIDGDMEIQADFLPFVYNEKDGLLFNFVSGNWIDYNYNNSWSLISKSIAKKNKNNSDSLVYTTGGLFLIKSSLWFKVGGMKNKLRRNQDWDIALRLAKQRVCLVRKNEVLAFHHTIPYNDKHRMWKLVFSGAKFYRMVILRDNLFNMYQWKFFFRINYTFLALVVSLLLIIFFQEPLYLLIYLFLIIGRGIINNERSLKLVLSSIILRLYYELLMIFALFLFWPKEHKEEYIKVE